MRFCADGVERVKKHAAISDCKACAKHFSKNMLKTLSRRARARLVSTIMDMVRASCAPSFGFVRFHNDTWWEVDEVTARQKVTKCAERLTTFQQIQVKYPGKGFQTTTEECILFRRPERVVHSRMACTVP
jgi:hypothetical protein